jgi:hypothetical protein
VGRRRACGQEPVQWFTNRSNPVNLPMKRTDAGRPPFPLSATPPLPSGGGAAGEGRRADGGGGGGPEEGMGRAQEGGRPGRRRSARQRRRPARVGLRGKSGLSRPAVQPTAPGRRPVTRRSRQVPRVRGRSDVVVCIAGPESKQRVQGLAFSSFPFCQAASLLGRSRPSVCKLVPRRFLHSADHQRGMASLRAIAATAVILLLAAAARASVEQARVQQRWRTRPHETRSPRCCRYAGSCPAAGRLAAPRLPLRPRSRASPVAAP